MTHPFSNPGAGARISATVKWYNPAKAYGFLVPEDGSPDIYCRDSALAAVGLNTLLTGATVDCETVRGPRGPEVSRILAVDFSTASLTPASSARAPGNGRMADNPGIGQAEKIYCPITLAANERRIPVPKAMQEAWVNLMQAQNSTLKDPADQYLRESFTLKGQGKYAAAAVAADLSSTLYAAEVTHRLTDIFSSTDFLRDFEAKWHFANLEDAEALGAAQVLKGYVDSMQLGRELYGHLGYHQMIYRQPIIAQDAAMLAIWLSDGRSTELQAQSWAVFGNEAFNAEDYVAAHDAYTNAMTLGAEQGWIKGNQSYAWNFVKGNEEGVNAFNLKKWFDLVSPGEISHVRDSLKSDSPYYVDWKLEAQELVERARQSARWWKYN